MRGDRVQRATRRRQGTLVGALALLVPGLLLTPSASAAGHRAPAEIPAQTTGASTAAPAAQPGAQPGERDGRVSWRPELSRLDGDDVNVTHSSGALRVRGDALRPASVDAGRGYGSAVLEARSLDRTVDRVAVRLDARVPSGARVAVDVRGRADGGSWTEWREARRGDPAALPRAVSEVQARLTLWSAEDGTSPAVRGLRLTADATGRPEEARERQTAGAFTARVFATREGLVGHTTANGHVIQPNDHFVALPSRRGLSPRGSGEYSVRVCGPARCETAPVWDVGPWNTRDDYWNPSATREQWKDLPRGLPEAQAAYQDGYNGGRDQYGRQVANPAGIDLADGTFYNVGLNDNGWVTVTYLWTDDGGDTTSFPTWGSDVNIRKSATTDSAVVGTLPNPTTVRVRCQVRGQLVHYNGYSNDAWAYLPDYGGYVSNIFIDVPEAWLPGVPTC
ncbi:hypothetical protein [Streptomyces sp. JJ36]|uniref:hypothetical protein n=1 Tax=Streptomyces sp. JJ36 TaxID=2736645 RepID=UPI001F177255|nr:hypothetical protein [Streptomyces sp. JJ36]